MIQIASQDHLARVTAMTRAAKLDALEQEILARAPRPSARVHVSLSPVESRSEFLSYVRLAGPKEDVLDFAAVLFAEVKGMVRPDGTLPLSLSAIESESSEHIQLVIAREMYEG